MDEDDLKESLFNDLLSHPHFFIYLTRSFIRLLNWWEAFFLILRNG